MRFGSFRKFGVPYVGVLTIRILLFRAPYLGPLSSKTPISAWGYRGFKALGTFGPPAYGLGMLGVWEALLLGDPELGWGSVC